GAKMAMASTTMTWRAENNDLLKRMGDLRLKKDEDGIWARYYSGHNEFDNNGSFSSKYKAFQVGFDSEMPHGWLGGVAFSFNDGTSTYNNGGHGDNDIKSLAFYGTKVNKDGQYIDLIAKLSHLENEYTVFNDYGFSLDGDYKNYGMSLSAEYGKKIPLKNNAYIIPSAELTVGRIGSKSYNAWSEYYEKNLSVEQDAFDSVVGRLNVCVGQETPRGSYYVKVGAAHEFFGSFDTTYSAMNEPTSSTNIDFKDTWLEMRVGGSIKLKNDAVLYGSFGKTLAGDIKEKWRVDAGLMFTFSDFKEFFMGSPKKSNLTTVSETETEIATINEVNNTATVEDAGVEMDGNKASVSVGDGVAIMETKPIAGTENVFMLDECVVTANRTKQRITDATADISVVTRQEIENMNMKNVEEALRTVPGIQFQNYGGGNQLNANISGLRINGSKDIAVLVDGVKINDFQGIGESGYMYAGVLNNMNNIERIEVLRGAAGTLYGSGAKGGVINIITRDIEESKTVTDVSLGSFGQEDYKFNTMGKEGKFTYNIYEGTSRQGDIKDGKGNTWEGHTKSKSYGTKLIYDIDDKNKVTLDYMDISSNYSGTDAIYNNTYQGKYDSTMMNVRHDLQINDNITNTFVYRHNNEKRFHSQQYYTGLSLKNSDTNYSYDFLTDQFTYHDQKNNLVVGVDYSKGKDKNTTKVEGHNVNREMRNVSLYVNEDFKILKNVTLSAGIRRDAPKEDDYGGKIEDH
ncbi:MAG: autotransporter outer membrane beta-barrel domain-containing protein, partial [Phascolarctobacterium sp.]|nr:autotransporter outer membrane beta-barrel domain-containing protein [Candidatus Phascolarctobacterium caballi]